MREHDTPARVLSKSEIKRLLGAADAHTDTTTGLRNRTALELGLWAGLKIGEVCRLEAGDFDMQGQQLTVRDGAGQVDRTIPLRRDTDEWCRRWEARRNAASYWWLHTVKAGVTKAGEERLAGGPLSRDNLRHALLRLTREGNVNTDGLTWQTLRRTFARTALVHGLSRGDLAQLMGLSLGALDRYVEGEVGDLAERVQALSFQPALPERRTVDPEIERLLSAWTEVAPADRRELVELVEERRRGAEGLDNGAGIA